MVDLDHCIDPYPRLAFQQIGPLVLMFADHLILPLTMYSCESNVLGWPPWLECQDGNGFL